MENTTTPTTPVPVKKKPKTALIVILSIVGFFIILSIIGRFLPKTETNNTTQGKEISCDVPKEIVLGNIKYLPTGFKVECAFMKDIGYTDNVCGTMQIDVYNWEMTDNVSYTDPETYAFGNLIATKTIDITSADLTKETIASKLYTKIDYDKKPRKTYLTALFKFTPKGETKPIIAGSSYETILH